MGFCWHSLVTFCCYWQKVTRRRQDKKEKLLGRVIHWSQKEKGRWRKPAPSMQLFYWNGRSFVLLSKPGSASELRIAHGAGMQLHVPDIACLLYTSDAADEL